MGSTHTSLHYHAIFSTKGRSPLIARDWRTPLHEYLAGCLRGLGGTPLRVDGVEDHVHMLFGLKAIIALADVVREVKKASTSWVRQRHNPRFHWQEEYGAFTVSRRDLASTEAYVRNQEAHHREKTFQEEYLDLLTDQGIEYDPRFLW